MLIEIAIGSLTNRGIIIDSKDLFRYVKLNEELYRSYFGFDNQIREHIKSGRKTPSGFIGNFYINNLVLDVDKGSDTLENTIGKMRNLANRLIKDFELEDNFQLWFSGTGFHFHIPNIFKFTPSPKLPLIARHTIESYFPEVDTKPIHARGLIRVGRTINLKSKLYKIPIKESEIWFLNEEQLKSWSRDQRMSVKPIMFDTPNKMFNVMDLPEERDIMIEVTKPTNIVSCMQHCYNAGEVVGTRHNRMIAMSSWLRRAGIPLKAAIAMMKVYAPSLDAYEVERQITYNYEKEYNFGCDSMIMKQFCDSQCIFYSKKNYLPDVFGSNELDVQYRNSMEKGWQKNSINLADFFGITHEKGYWLRPGHVIGIMADTGNSKSALLQNIALQYRDFGKILYINTEMPYEELYERFMQIRFGWNTEEVREYHSDAKNPMLKDIVGHIEYTKTVPDYNGVIDLVSKALPKILVIDVIDDIKPSKDRSIMNQEDMYAGFKDITRKYNMITFMVHHISKSGAVDEKGKAKTLTKHSAKGSSAFEQKCDILIGIEGDSDTPYRIVKSLKGRSTAPFNTHYFVNPETFVFERRKV